jgi:hypothetical protein
LTPRMRPKPAYARERSTDEKPHSHADLEKQNQISVAWSRCSKESFVQCIASVRAATLG